jgi:hypothetical protein
MSLTLTEEFNPGPPQFIAVAVDYIMRQSSEKDEKPYGFVNAWTSGQRSTPSGRIHRLQLFFHKKIPPSSMQSRTAVWIF